MLLMVVDAIAGERRERREDRLQHRRHEQAENACATVGKQPTEQKEALLARCAVKCATSGCGRGGDLADRACGGARNPDMRRS